MEDEELDNEPHWRDLPDSDDDGGGQYDPSEGCSYCGHWQCSGCTG